MRSVYRPARFTICIFLILFSLLTESALANHLPNVPNKGKADHSDWPQINGIIVGNKGYRERSLRGTDFNDELLGAHGDDRISGKGGSDVIWGDRYPEGQPDNQFDRLEGGEDQDDIYASHGKNTILAREGNDRIHAHFGYGLILCGEGDDLVYMSRKGQDGWELDNCEHKDFRPERLRRKDR